MFKKNKKQYATILRYDKQLKVNYQTFQDGKVLKKDSSVFLINDNQIPRDAVYKLEILQKEIPYTYLISLYDQYHKLEKIDGSKEFGDILLDEKTKIGVDKEAIKEFSTYFKETGIDYLLSPFTLLYENIKEYLNTNSLNILLLNNQLYILIVDNKKEIVYSEIKEITSFENIESSDFYSDEVIGQKLYEEIYFLELQQTILDLIDSYYKSEENIEFLESINIYYTIKQLNDDLIESLYETTMIDVRYYSIDFNYIIDNMIEKNVIDRYTLIKPRVKKSDNNLALWMGLSIATLLVLGGTLYYKKIDQENKIIEQQKQKEKVIQQKKKQQELIKQQVVKIPDHIQLNNNIIEKLSMFFDLVPYDAILLELSVKKDSSTFVTNFIVDSNSTKQMQEKLFNIYDNSKIILEHKNKAILSTIISNSGYKHLDKDIKNIEYQEYKFISIAKFTKYLRSIVKKDSKIKFVSKKRDNYLTYTYSVSSIYDTPKEFFDFIESLNKKDISINVTYPIEFAKIKDKIEVKYNIEFHQKNKKGYIVK